MGLRLIVVALTAAGNAWADEDVTHEIEQWRKERAQLLTRADGWLTLIGLHFLQTGVNTVGHAADNQVVLAAGPAHFGTVTVAPEGQLTFASTTEAEVQIEIDGMPARAATVVTLKTEGAGRETIISSGTVSFFAIERDGRKALRVKDSAAESRTHFAGLHYFPIDLLWRVEARWVPFRPMQEIPITNVLGKTTREKVPGKAVFEFEGKTYELKPILEVPGGPLFFVISDATSGRETYDAARFLYALTPKDGKVILDFNKAYNPPCAFTPFATCPLPPKENRLPFAVTAGEKKYQGREK